MNKHRILSFALAAGLVSLSTPVFAQFYTPVPYCSFGSGDPSAVTRDAGEYLSPGESHEFVDNGWTSPDECSFVVDASPENGAVFTNVRIKPVTQPSDASTCERTSIRYAIHAADGSGGWTLLDSGSVNGVWWSFLGQSTCAVVIDKSISSTETIRIQALGKRWVARVPVEIVVEAD